MDGGPASVPMPTLDEIESASSFGQVMDHNWLGEWSRIGLLSKWAGQFDGDG